MREDKQDLAQIRKWILNGANVFVKLAKGFGNGNDTPSRVIAILGDILNGGKGSPLSAVVVESEDGAKCAITENTFSMYDFYARYPAHLFENKKEDQSGDEMKESNDQSKFKELCDTAYKSAVNGDIIISHLSDDAIEFRCGSGNEEFYLTPSSDDCDIQDGINAINDLYYEEFVIDDLNDLISVNINDIGFLSNGSRFTVFNVKDNEKSSIMIIFHGGNFVWATIEILKGATIKQKKVD